MAQTEEVLDTGITEWVILMSDTTPAATAMTKIAGLEMATVCTAAKGSTFGDPADTAVIHDADGFDIAAIDTVAQAQTNTAGDTITFDHVFTASGTVNVAGFHTCNDDGDLSFIECCFNAVLAVESSDTITIDGECVVDQA